MNRNILNKTLIRRVGAAFILILFITIAVLLFYVTIPPGENLVGSIIEKRLASFLGQNVALSGFETNLFSRLRLTGLRVFEIHDEEKSTTLELDYLEIHYTLFGLVKNELSIKRIATEGLSVAISRDSSGAFNLPLARPAETNKPQRKRAMRVLLERVDIEDASLRYSDRVIPLQAGIDGLDAAAIRLPDGAYDFKIEIQAVEGEYRELPLEGSNLKIAGSADSGRVNVTFTAGFVALDNVSQNLAFRIINSTGSIEKGDAKELAYRLGCDTVEVLFNGLSLPARGLRLSGNLDSTVIGINDFAVDLPGMRAAGTMSISLNDDRSFLDGELTLKGDPEPLTTILASRLPEPLAPVRGMIDLNIRLQGPASGPRVGYSLTSSDLKLAGFHITGSRASGEWAEGRLTLDGGDLEILGGDIGIRGYFRPADLAFSLDAGIRNIDFGRFWQSLYGRPSPYRGIASGSLNSAGSLSSPEEIRLAADLDLIRASFQGRDLPDFKLDLVMLEKRFEFTVSQGDMRLAATAGAVGEEASGTFSVSVPRLEYLAGMFNVSELTGNLRASGSIEGKLDNPTLTAGIHGRNMSYRGFPATALDCDLIYSDKKLRIIGLRADGELAEMDSLRAPFGLADIAGGFHYRGTASGPLDSLSAQVEVEFRRLAYKKQPIGTGRASARLEGERITLDRLRLLHDSLLVDASGSYASRLSEGDIRLELFQTASGLNGRFDPDSLMEAAAEAGRLEVAFSLGDHRSATLKGENLVLDRLESLLRMPDGLNGKLSFDASVSGTTEQPRADVAFRLIEPRFKSAVMDSLTGRVRLTDDHLRIEPMEFFSGSYHSRVDLSIELARTAKGLPTLTGQCGLSGRARGERFDLSFINFFLPVNVRIAGRGDYDLRLYGSLGSPRPKGSLKISDGSFTSGRDTLTVLELDASLAGEPESIAADLAFKLTNLKYQSVAIDWVRGRVTLTEDRFRIEPIEFSYGDHHSMVELTVGLERQSDGRRSLSGKSPLQGRVEGNNLDLQMLNPFLPGGVKVAGRADYDLRLDGSLGNPQPWGFIDITDGSVHSEEDSRMVRDIALRLAFSKSLLEVNRFEGKIGDTPFNLQARVSSADLRRFALTTELNLSDYGRVLVNGLASRDSLDLEIRSEGIDLRALQPLVPDLKTLSGDLDINVWVSGDAIAPMVNGSAVVRNLTLQPPWLNRSFDHGVIKLRFNQNAIKLDSLYTSADKGSIYITGGLTYAGRKITGLDLAAEINDFAVIRPGEMNLTVKSARLTYARKENYYLLDGDIFLGESRFVVNFKPQSVLPFARKVERPKPEQPEILKATRLDVRLRESEDIWVNNNLSRLHLGAELRIIGSPVRPNLTGRVTVREGYILYLDRKFEIQRGALDFIDPDRINPILDLEARAQLKAYQVVDGVPYDITINLYGPLDEARFDLSSEPPLDKSDIIALLTIGTTREQLTGNVSGRDLLLKRAQTLTSQGISRFMSRRLGNLLGLDEVTIEGNLFEFGRSWGPQLFTSKKVTDRMEISYSTTVGHLNEQSIRLDYRLSRYFSLEGQTDQRGRSGLDLVYKLRFK